jgi:hypothetical protein
MYKQKPTAKAVDEKASENKKRREETKLLSRDIILISH